ncbi:three component ABC system middle component, partial [Vibrio anguillarum]|uniref:three component ABC system middle component n=2 Tax=Vibrionaceae TaxID=641 RepID=UPI001BE46FE3
IISLDKVLLIYPIVYQKSLLNIISRKSNTPKSFEQLIINHPDLFSDFDNIYYSNLSLSINSIQYLHEMEYINLNEGVITVNKEIEFNKKMGPVVEKYYNSASCIAKILSMPSEYLYLNLRINL